MPKGREGEAAKTTQAKEDGMPHIAQNYYQKQNTPLMNSYIHRSNLPTVLVGSKEDKEFIKSPMNYTGGKYKLLGQLLNNIPDEPDIVVDLFAGGLDFSLNVNASKVISNDIIKELKDLYQYWQIHDYQYLINELDSRINELGLSKTNKRAYNRLVKQYNKQPNSRDFFLLVCYGFNNQIRFSKKNHKFNTSFGKGRSHFTSNMRENFRKLHKKFKSSDFSFTSQDFRDFDFSELTENSFVYIDSPYTISLASYMSGAGEWSYQEDQDLFKICDELDKRGIKFAMSNVFENKGLVNQPLIEWSQKYNVIHLEHTYKNCSYQRKNKNSKTDEVLITNYVVVNIDEEAGQKDVVIPSDLLWINDEVSLELSNDKIAEQYSKEPLEKRRVYNYLQTSKEDLGIYRTFNKDLFIEEYKADS